MRNDLKAAIRLVASDNAVLEVTPGVLKSHGHTHHPEPGDSLAPIKPADDIAVSADQNKVIRYRRSFPGGCCVGIDELRPAHLSDIVVDSTAEAGLRLRQILRTKSCAKMSPAMTLNFCFRRI